MASTGEAAAKGSTAPDPEDPRKPDNPPELKGRTWGYSLKSALGEFTRDQCTDLAAALTYYSVLSLFPALLALVSLLGVFGQGETTVQALLDIVDDIGPSTAAEQLRGPVTSMVGASGAGARNGRSAKASCWACSPKSASIQLCRARKPMVHALEVHPCAIRRTGSSRAGKGAWMPPYAAGTNRSVKPVAVRSAIVASGSRRSVSASSARWASAATNSSVIRPGAWSVVMPDKLPYLLVWKAVSGRA